MKSSIICTVLFVVAAGGTLADARGQALPNWRIGDSCAKESAPGQCAAFEGEALAVISATWAFVSDPIKQTCLSELRRPPDQSWRLLAECIDAEASKIRDRTAVKTAKTPAEPGLALEVQTPRPTPQSAASPPSVAPTVPPKAQ